VTRLIRLTLSVPREPIVIGVMRWPVDTPLRSAADHARFGARFPGWESYSAGHSRAGWWPGIGAYEEQTQW